MAIEITKENGKMLDGGPGMYRGIPQANEQMRRWAEEGGDVLRPVEESEEITTGTIVRITPDYPENVRERDRHHLPVIIQYIRYKKLLIPLMLGVVKRGDFSPIVQPEIADDFRKQLGRTKNLTTAINIGMLPTYNFIPACDNGSASDTLVFSVPTVLHAADGLDYETSARYAIEAKLGMGYIVCRVDDKGNFRYPEGPQPYKIEIVREGYDGEVAGAGRGEEAGDKIRGMVEEYNPEQELQELVADLEDMQDGRNMDDPGSIPEIPEPIKPEAGEGASLTETVLRRLAASGDISEANSQHLIRVLDEKYGGGEGAGEPEFPEGFTEEETKEFVIFHSIVVSDALEAVQEQDVTPENSDLIIDATKAVTALWELSVRAQLDEKLAPAMKEMYRDKHKRNVLARSFLEKKLEESLE